MLILVGSAFDDTKWYFHCVRHLLQKLHGSSKLFPFSPTSVQSQLQVSHISTSCIPHVHDIDIITLGIVCHLDQRFNDSGTSHCNLAQGPSCQEINGVQACLATLLKDQLGLLALVVTACSLSFSEAVWSALPIELVKTLQQTERSAAVQGA